MYDDVLYYVCLINVIWIATFKKVMEVKIAQQIVSGDCGSIIMDELSILHYQSDLNETTGQVSYKLALFDFLDLVALRP